MRGELELARCQIAELTGEDAAEQRRSEKAKRYGTKGEGAIYLLYNTVHYLSCPRDSVCRMVALFREGSSDSELLI